MISEVVSQVLAIRFLLTWLTDGEEFIGSYLVSRVGVTYKTGFGLDLLQLMHSQLGTTGNRALSLIYTLYSSPLHTH
jgi:hypothetical protein